MRLSAPMGPVETDTAPAGYVPSRTLARVAIGALLLRSCVHLPQLAFIPLAHTVVATLGPERAMTAVWGLTAATAAGLLLAGIAFVMWTYRVVANARVFAEDEMPFTPSEAAWSWFIPIVNLVRPYQVMRAVERSALPVGGSPSSLVSSWWAAYLGRLVLQSGVAMATTSMDEGARTAGALASIAAELVSVGLAVALVLYIERLQSERAAMTATAIAEVFS